MKTVISTVLIFISLLIGLWYYSLHQVRKPFRCDAQQISVQVKGQKSIVLNANATVIFSSSKNGIVYISGSIKESDTRYLLARKIFFTITPSEIKGTNNTQLTHEEVHPGDNTPEKIWRDFLLPEIQHVDFYSEIKKLRHNALLISGVTNPFLVCTKQD
ncbi:hypothetical protein AV650_25270 [Serratia fonticola]|uniref:hypothetical protein n=1 Tax=Serratia fonticola TaxID=47917 RepID=UPI000743004A|nr:hypothetical protein [Serratia fonticola]ALX96642.1 hypothetical protein AV650_25270 [Serratia fonticola]PAA99068.1 hypothetical protein CJJ13_03755 [Serratia fonticola]